MSVSVPTFLGKNFERKDRTVFDFLANTSGALVGPLIGNLFVYLFGWKGNFVISLLMFAVFFFL
ncbi:hypothetical protein B4135_2509 [Caldibacillus debilis]|uniref:Major facilitator superfamily (MFS) profile domain-containing protein n=1 Tax=Caldibacillus debilis TaxID=301148 RepID=A0A150LYV5_9BACI|nr:hypothetical protein B4135_2509 [Caldibacillus debilis]